jgi:hypothetical protein
MRTLGGAGKTAPFRRSPGRRPVAVGHRGSDEWNCPRSPGRGAERLVIAAAPRAGAHAIARGPLRCARSGVSVTSARRRSLDSSDPPHAKRRARWVNRRACAFVPVCRRLAILSFPLGIGCVGKIRIIVATPAAHAAAPHRKPRFERSTPCPATRSLGERRHRRASAAARASLAAWYGVLPLFLSQPRFPPLNPASAACT